MPRKATTKPAAAAAPKTKTKTKTTAKKSPARQAAVTPKPCATRPLTGSNMTL